jgi:hypothetical protein
MHAQMVFKMLDGLVKGLLASFKMLTNSQDCSESHIRISVPAPLLCHWWIVSSVHVIAGFWNHFQDHSGFWNNKQKEPWFFSIFFTSRQTKISKAICAHSKGIDLTFRTLKKYSSHDTFPVKGL